MLSHRTGSRLTLVLALLVVLAGCGTTDADQATNTTASPAATSVAANTAAQEDATAAPAETMQAPSNTSEATVEAGTLVAATSEATPSAKPSNTAAPTLTVPPTITAAPTATASPLAAGWWDDAVCYEIFVRSFYDGDGDGIGDFKGLASRLDYLNDGDPATTNDLDINCIWLMPVAESPSYHGYDVVDYRKIEPDYGTNDDFKAFMAEAHKRGIQVIVDLVLNHTSREHPWFKEASSDPQSKYRDWYLWAEDNPGYRGPWNQGVWHTSPAGAGYYYGIFCDCMPDLDYRNPEVTAEAQAITRFWVEEMGVDGFRLDAIRHLIESGRVQQDTRETHAWLRDYRTFLGQLGRPVYTVGEVLVPSTSTISTYYPDQLDAFFEFAVADGIIKASNSGIGPSYLNAVKNATAALPFQRYAPLLTNHDQNRVMGQLLGDVGKAKIAATALLTAPGLPFIYYGEEIGMLGAKTGAPKYDEPIRAPMQWTGDDKVGFTEGTPWTDVQTKREQFNVAVQNEDPASLLNLYRRLIRLHREHPALATGDFTPLKASDGSVAAFLRQAEGEDILVVLNFGKSAKEGLTIEVAESSLEAGTYQLEGLLAEAQAAPLTVNSNGAITGYAPLPALEPHTGYIFKIIK